MKKSQNVVFDREALRKELLQNAKAVGIPRGAAENIVEPITNNVTKWIEKRSIATQDDLYRKIAQETEKYNQDLAYVYQNRGKII